MTVALKYCGLTRPEDAAVAGELGAAYVGVIFAGGPRMLSAAFARQVLDAAGAGVLRVGVFGAQPPEDLARAADEARLDIVQLHADPTPDDVATARAATSCEVWGAVRISAREPARIGAPCPVPRTASCSTRKWPERLAVLERRSIGRQPP